MRILISGGSGQLGQDCTLVLRNSHDVISLNSRELDITNAQRVEMIVKQINPAVIVNCAAYTKVDSCETERNLAWKLNAEGPRNLALVSEKNHSLLIHFSTDYVFDGMRPVPEPYLENDPPNPLSYYGKTKLEGEKMIQEIPTRYIILRTAWLYGARGVNFLKTMLRLASAKPEKEIKVVNDQFGSPTWSYTLALQVEKLIEIQSQGIYHATAEGYCTWYELARSFLKAMDVPHEILPCATSDYPTPAVRPKNSILENYHLKREGINCMQPWNTDLVDYVTRFRTRLLTETGVRL